MPHRWIALAFLLAGVSPALADDMKMPGNSTDLKWGPAPPALPKGAEITVLSGDPLQGRTLRCPLEDAGRLQGPRAQSSDHRVRDRPVR